MAIERTMEGLEARLKPHGAGRFLGAGFLMFWLCGWAVGETIVLWLLVKGAYALVTGAPPSPGREPLPLGPTLAVGAFLLLWLSLWTVGGIAAIHELLRLLWGQDRILADRDGIVLTRFRGPFRSKRRIARTGLRNLLVLGRNGMLAVETDRKRVDLSALGSLNERYEAATALRAELGIDEKEAVALDAELPEGWQEIVTPEGDAALVGDIETRRKQARVASLVAFGAALVASVLVFESLKDARLAALAIMASVVAGGLAWGATWLVRGRMEWGIGAGRVVLRRRFGARIRELIEARRLELTVTSDSDGDEWFALEAIALPPASEPNAKRKSRRIVRTMNDPLVPRRLGAWLARRAELPFEDRSKDDTRSAEIARLGSQLPQLGKLGHVVEQLIEHGERGRRKI